MRPAAPPISPIALIRVSSLGPILFELDRQNRRCEPLLKRHLLSRAMLADPYAEIPLQRYLAFLEDAAATAGDLSLCARVGARFRAADLGPVGLVFGASGTLRRGLERLAHLLSAWQDATAIGVEVQAEMLVWTYRIDHPAQWMRRQDNEYTLSATVAIARNAFGVAGRPLEVHVAHDEPDDASMLTRALGIRPQYGQVANRLFFDLAAAERLHRVEDQALIDVLTRHLADLSHLPEPDDLLQRIRRLVLFHLGQRPVNLPLIAAELNISTRTLQRRLTDEGTSLRAILRQTRLEQATAQLRDSRAPTAEIARKLGYADSTSFWRALKTATGKPPTDHRGG